MQNYQETWDKILGVIERNVPRESFLTWFGPLKPLGEENGALRIGAPNRFFYEFLEAHYRQQLQSALKEVSGGNLRIQYQILKDGVGENVPADPQPASTFLLRDTQYDKRTQLNPRYTFENFIEGDSNFFSKAAALAVAEAPGKTRFNPLFIYGPTGLGKTHLIQAAGNFSLTNNRTRRVIYVTSEKFVNDFIFAIKTYKTTDFSSFYRTVDLLLLDDVQFFQGKERTQLEFFHTFNSLYQTGKQIVLTSDRPPKELDDFDNRLISRIGWGLVTDIGPPAYETRLAILQKRSDIDGIPLPDDVADYLASVITDNVRHLESALIRLMAHCSISGTELTLALAKEVLRDQIRPATTTISIEFIQEKVAEYFNLSPDLIIARNRKKEVAWARQMAMYLCTVLTDSTLQSIGLHFGNRDHSTVIHAKNFVGKAMAQDPKVAKDAEQLKLKIASV